MFIQNLAFDELSVDQRFGLVQRNLLSLELITLLLEPNLVVLNRRVPLLELFLFLNFAPHRLSLFPKVSLLGFPHNSNGLLSCLVGQLLLQPFVFHICSLLVHQLCDPGLILVLFLQMVDLKLLRAGLSQGEILARVDQGWGHSCHSKLVHFQVEGWSFGARIVLDFLYSNLAHRLLMIELLQVLVYRTVFFWWNWDATRS